MLKSSVYYKGPHRKHMSFGKFLNVLKISSVNVHKSGVMCGVVDIFWGYPWWKTWWKKLFSAEYWS